MLDCALVMLGPPLFQTGLQVHAVGDGHGFSPQFESEPVDQVLGGGLGFGRVFSPLGWRQEVFGFEVGEGLVSGEEEEGVGGGGEGGIILDGVFGSDLGLSDADDLFFIAVVDFDAPSPDVVLEDDVEGEIEPGANEIRGFTVEEFTALSGPVAEGSDDDEAEGEFGSGGGPQQWSEGLDLEEMFFAGGEDGDGLPGEGLVLAELFGGGSPLAVNFFAAGSGVVVVGRKEHFGVAADSSDQVGARGKVSEHGLIGEAPVHGHH